MRPRLVAQQFNWAERDDVTEHATSGRCTSSCQQSVIAWTQGRCRGAMSGRLGLQCRFLSRTA